MNLPLVCMERKKRQETKEETRDLTSMALEWPLSTINHSEPAGSYAGGEMEPMPLGYGGSTGEKRSSRDSSVNLIC